MTATPTPTTTNTAAALGRPGAAGQDRGHAFRRGWVGTAVTHLCLIVGVVLSIFPFYWLLVMSTSTNAEIFGYPPSLWFGGNALANVASVFSNVDMLRSSARCSR
jgi:cellobiose transport system permease protein